MDNKWDVPNKLTTNGPKYLAIAKHIEEAVEAGKLAAGERLPSNRDLGEKFGVTIATITKAMSVVIRKGLVITKVGSGTYVCGNHNSGKILKSYELSLNVLPYSPIVEIVNQNLRLPSHSIIKERLFSRGSYLGTNKHNNLAAKWLGTFGVNTSPDNIFLIAGVHQGLFAAFMSLTKHGDTVICENLTYTGIKRIAATRGVNLLGANCDSSGMLPESLEELIQTSGARVLITIPTLHNPTMITMPLERRKKIVEICKRHNVVIVEDGVNMPLDNGDIPSISSLLPELSIHLTGFSKCVSSGFRLGYAVVSPVLQDLFLDALVSTQWFGPSFYTNIAVDMLESKLIFHCAELHRKEAIKRQGLVQSILTRVNTPVVPCYHAWVNLPNGWADKSFANHVMRLGIKVSPSSHFSVNPSNVFNSYRISLGACESINELETALKTLARVEGQSPSNLETLV